MSQRGEMPSAIGNSFIKTLVKSPLHVLAGKGLAVIIVKGRKTGKSFETPINVIPIGETLTVVSFRKRTWWRNLRGGRPAQLQHAGKRCPCAVMFLKHKARLKQALQKSSNNILATRSILIPSSVLMVNRTPRTWFARQRNAS